MRDFFENHRRVLAAILILAFFVLGLLTMIDDSAIVDEIAHIPAGFSYLASHDFRLNPEHPPLIKDLSGMSLLPLPLAFPLDHPSWTKDVNGQWETGWHFLYHYGNNADLMLIFARLPILLLAVSFGLLIYVFARRYFGTGTALLALFFYALDPNFIAHSHFVTTDLGIAFFIFLALTTFAVFLKQPSLKTLGYATLALAGAQAAKFSAVLLLPFYLVILLIYAASCQKLPRFQILGSAKIKNRSRQKFYVYIVSYLLMSAGALGLVWAFYALHTFNFPAEKQIELIQVSLAGPVLELPRNILTELTKISFFQPLAQYLLGVVMVFGRVAGGNTTYFLGQVTNQSFKWYFPVSYLLKVPLPFLLLLTLSTVLGLLKLRHFQFRQFWAACSKFVVGNYIKLILLLFVLYYAGISIAGNLNLGVRHLFPIFSLLYILVADSVFRFFTGFKDRISSVVATSLLALLIFWYAVSTLFAFPHYLSYHNEIIGGGKNAYLYFTDSNVDWGQDLKRFRDWLKQHPEIKKIKLDYFGGGEPKYYFCNRTYDNQGQLIRTSSGYDCANSVYEEWHTQYGKTTGWIAVSVTFLQNAEFYAQRLGQPDYDWLRYRTPYAKIGNSIFVYWVR